jgi:aspartyl-tRNA(Asn)/glutamyl-tRNA(Gln) amidotransferase subunit A
LSADGPRTARVAEEVLSEDVAYFSVSELTSEFRRGTLSPVEVARIALERIDALNPTINAFSQLDRSVTLQAAEESERRWRAGTPRGPLDGVPFSVKDTLVAKGFATRRGSRTTSTNPATQSSPIVDRALEQGAVILGITTTPEFGGGPVTISPLTGITRNPWDPSKTSGGSSGGAAASIAAGIGAFALGTDAGGSIRIPAALCGAVGFKPTGGRVPAYPASVAGALASPGPIARSVEDCALVVNCATQPDSRDPDAITIGREDFAAELGKGIEGCRIAFSLTLGYAKEVDPEVEALVTAAASVLRSLGSEVEELDPPIEDPLPLYKTFFTVGFAHSLRHLDAEQMGQIGPALRDMVDEGRKVTLTRYLEAQEGRRALASAMEGFHQRYPLLVTPTVAVPAFDADRWYPESFEKYNEPRAWVPFGNPFNLTQQPAISVPCGFTRAGLPVGLQIVGPRFADALVLRAAKALESAGICPLRRPPLPSCAGSAGRAGSGNHL